MHKLLIVFLFIFSGIFLQAQSQGEANLANEYFNDAEYEKALELYQKLYRQNENETFYVSRIADCYLQLNNPDAALAFVEKVIRKNSEEFSFTALRGFILYRSGKQEEAAGVWDD